MRWRNSFASFALHQRGRDPRRREYVVHRARSDGAARHAVIVGLADLLGDD